MYLNILDFDLYHIFQPEPDSVYTEYSGAFLTEEHIENVFDFTRFNDVFDAPSSNDIFYPRMEGLIALDFCCQKPENLNRKVFITLISIKYGD